MKVILTQDMDNLGSIGQVVAVKPGYARNYLIPRSLAVVANDKKVKEIEHYKRGLAKKKEALLNGFRAVAKKIEALTVTLDKQVGESEKIFGSVTTAEIEEQLLKSELQVSRKQIKISDEIKKLGDYTAEVQLHAEVVAKLKLKVVASA